MGKKEVAIVALDPEYETYIVYIRSVSSNASPSFSQFNVYSSQQSQISGLIVEETPTKVFAKYSNFANIFFLDLTFELPEHTRINDHAIKLVDGQQPPYGPIYSLELVELKILKAYIEINLANGFIRSSKSLIGALIQFDRKSDNSFQLCVNYWDLNNLTINNQYLLPRIGKLLNRLKKAKQFI